MAITTHLDIIHVYTVNRVYYSTEKHTKHNN